MVERKLTIVSQEGLKLLGRSYEAMRLLLAGGLPEEVLQAIISDPAYRESIIAACMRIGNFSGVYDSVPISLEEVIRILGPKKVISARKSSEKMGLPRPKNQIIRYNRSDIKEAAEGNKKGRNWQLIWTNGLSPLQIREKIGISPENKFCFHQEGYYLDRNQQLANKHPEAGYYLIDFAKRFNEEMTWYFQEKMISSLGNSFERADEVVFTEACFIIALTSGKMPAEGWCHLSGTVGSETPLREYIAAGYFSGSWDFSSFDPDYKSYHLDVAVVKKRRPLVVEI
jgi:hypothetical protein